MHKHPVSGSAGNPISSRAAKKKSCSAPCSSCSSCRARPRRLQSSWEAHREFRSVDYLSLAVRLRLICWGQTLIGRSGSAFAGGGIQYRWSWLGRLHVPGFDGTQQRIVGEKLIQQMFDIVRQCRLSDVSRQLRSRQHPRCSVGETIRFSGGPHRADAWGGKHLCNFQYPADEGF